jgi:hypothetical protein
MKNLAAKAAVTEESVHVLVARETPMAILFPFEHGQLRPDGVIGGIGILDELRFARV